MKRITYVRHDLVTWMMHELSFSSLKLTTISLPTLAWFFYVYRLEWQHIHDISAPQLASGTDIHFNLSPT